MEDTKYSEQNLRDITLMMKSNRRERLGRHCDWSKICESLFKEVFNLHNWSILEKGGKLLCFIVSHEEGCDRGEYTCNCSTPYSERLIKVYFFSHMFAEMISVLHSQLYFSIGSFGQLRVSSNLIVSFDSAICCDMEDVTRIPDYPEFEKERSPDFQKMRDEFNTLICKYLKLAFTNPTSLPPFLLNSDKGLTMHLSELLAWLESE